MYEIMIDDKGRFFYPINEVHNSNSFDIIFYGILIFAYQKGFTGINWELSISESVFIL